MNLTTSLELQTCGSQIKGNYLFWKECAENNSFENVTQKYNSAEGKILSIINLKALDAFEKLIDSMRENCSLEDKTKFSYCVPFFRTVAQHYIANACDSVFKRLLSSSSPLDYSLEIDLRFTFSNTSLRLDVEDNGLGIAPEVEMKIFHEKVTSKDHPTNVQIGGVGVGLLNVQLYSNNLKGKIGFINKGIDKGAIFSFEAPLQACEEKICSENYRSHCMRAQMYNDCNQS